MNRHLMKTLLIPKPSRAVAGLLAICALVFADNTAAQSNTNTTVTVTPANVKWEQTQRDFEIPLVQGNYPATHELEYKFTLRGANPNPTVTMNVSNVIMTGQMNSSTFTGGFGGGRYPAGTYTCKFTAKLADVGKDYSVTVKADGGTAGGISTSVCNGKIRKQAFNTTNTVTVVTNTPVVPTTTGGGSGTRINLSPISSLSLQTPFNTGPLNSTQRRALRINLRAPGGGQGTTGGSGSTTGGGGSTTGGSGSSTGRSGSTTGGSGSTTGGSGSTTRGGGSTTGGGGSNTPRTSNR